MSHNTKHSENNLSAVIISIYYNNIYDIIYMIKKSLVFETLIEIEKIRFLESKKCAVRERLENLFYSFNISVVTHWP